MRTGGQADVDDAVAAVAAYGKYDYDVEYDDEDEYTAPPKREPSKKQPQQKV
jgi:hypothetical protein